MATRLRKLKITRVAVCTQGANPDADILLFKSLDGIGKQDDDEECTCTDEGKDDDCPVHGKDVEKAMKQWVSSITKRADFDDLSDSAKLQLFYDLVDHGSLGL